MMNQGKIPVLYAGKYSMYVSYKNSVSSDCPCDG